MCLFSCSLQPNSELLTVNFSNQRRDMCQFWYSFELPSTVLSANFLKECRDMCRFWYPLEPAVKVLTVNFFHRRRDMCLFWFCQRHVGNFQSAPESSQSPREACRVMSEATRVLPKSCQSASRDVHNARKLYFCCRIVVLRNENSYFHSHCAYYGVFTSKENASKFTKLIL